MRRPRLLIAALRGNAGKTLISVALVGLLHRKGLNVAPFKKGPDFIDAQWLAAAANQDCFNLDPFMMTDAQILHSFLANSRDADIVLIEGNRGLFDGMDAEGTCSSAGLAKLLRAPVILIIDATKTTRTAAAMVQGCMQFDPGVGIKGVILNRVAGARHEDLLRRSIEGYCCVPVLGILPKETGVYLPQKHLGLVPPGEWGGAAAETIVRLGDKAERYLDVEKIIGIARCAPDLTGDHPEPLSPFARSVQAEGPRIGIVRDEAFNFYYPENISGLKAMGATLVEIDAINDRSLPELDGLYIGGGFPENHAEALADNAVLRNDLYEASVDGLPVYAECGGLIYLAEGLVFKGKRYPMAGVFPVLFGMEERPQGHGYTIFKVVGENPYLPLGKAFKAHEFHYSRVLNWKDDRARTVFKMIRGTGLGGGRDGLCYLNVLATYSHLHALAAEAWIRGFYELARCRSRRQAERIHQPGVDVLQSV